MTAIVFGLRVGETIAHAAALTDWKTLDPVTAFVRLLDEPARTALAQALAGHTTPAVPVDPAEHPPLMMLNTTGTGRVRWLFGCGCGWKPLKAAATADGIGRAWRAHARKAGVDPDAAPPAVYAAGYGYPAEGMTWTEWNTANPGRDPFTGANVR